MALEAQVKIKYCAPLKEFNRYEYPSYQHRMQDPWGYLDEVGIDTVCEFILNGVSPREMCRQINVSQRIINAWLRADEGRLAAYEQAFQEEADNMMFEGKEILNNTPMLSEAISLSEKKANHLRLMAKGFGSKRWGSKVDVNATIGVSLNYSFDVGLLPEQQARIIEGECKAIEQAPAVLDVNELIGAGGAADLIIPKTEHLTYEEAKAQEEG
jgi:hypothetical protein